MVTLLPTIVSFTFKKFWQSHMHFNFNLVAFWIKIKMLFSFKMEYSKACPCKIGEFAMLLEIINIPSEYLMISMTYKWLIHDGPCGNTILNQPILKRQLWFVHSRRRDPMSTQLLFESSESARILPHTCSRRGRYSCMIHDY